MGPVKETEVTDIIEQTTQWLCHARECDEQPMEMRLTREQMSRWLRLVAKDYCRWEGVGGVLEDAMRAEAGLPVMGYYRWMEVSVRMRD